MVELLRKRRQDRRALARARVVRAWMVPGKVPAHHFAMKGQLRKEWPVLAAALDELSKEYYE